MKKVKVYIERAEDGRFWAYAANPMILPYGLTGEGDSVELAKADWNNVYAATRAQYEEEGKPFTEAEFLFSYDVPSFLRYYAGKLTFAGLSRITGISAAQLSQYANGYRNPSQKTTEKIQSSLHAFGDEVRAITLI